MRKILVIVNLFLSLMFVSSCGKDTTETPVVSDSGSANSQFNGYGGYYNTYASCKMINGGSLGGCCSSHGGAKSCASGMYSFTADNKLICIDGTISPTCTGK